MEIRYRTDFVPDTESIVELYISAGLNRPVDDLNRIARMYSHSNLVVTAWMEEELAGIARSLSDFSFCCYLSDLAVRKEYQNSGIGRELIKITRDAIGPECMLLLLSAPSAMQYYPKVGFDKVENGFIVQRQR
jgi:GNAT superfamily N-acetyltransferase